jgi:peptidoglycan/xylan/chitin deacetylase (PgdA/CDA1 family)
MNSKMKIETVVATNNTLLQPPTQVQEMSLAEKPLTRIVTTSWDDGDPFDLRMAEWLAAREIPGTFYIPVKGHVQGHHRTCRMSLAEMLELNSQGFEIGAHGVSHPNLPECDEQQLIVEVESCKKRLEDDLGNGVSMFAYPRGRHNKKVIAAVKKAGYAGARTTAMLGSQLIFDPFRMPTSVHVYPHTRLEYVRNLARAWELGRAWMCATHLRCASNWVELAKLLFDSVLRSGGIWHLYGHSWEIEELRLWGGLQEVLDYVAKRPGVTYVSNGAAVQMRTSQLAGVTCAAPATTP